MTALKARCNACRTDAAVPEFTMAFRGMITAIDDFGAGHSGLNMLADFQPDIIKVDKALTRAINTDPIRFEIARAVIELCARLHISVIAEGVETLAKAITLRDLGIRVFQGYLFAKPVLEQLPTETPQRWRRFTPLTRNAFCLKLHNPANPP